MRRALRVLPVVVVGTFSCRAAAPPGDGSPASAPTAAASSPAEARVIVSDRASLERCFGRRCELRGRYERRPLANLHGRVWTHGPFLVLSDGLMLFIHPPEARTDEEIARLDGRVVLVRGIVRRPDAPSFDIGVVVAETIELAR